MNNDEKKYVPSVETILRRHVQKVPEAVYRCSGINIKGKRINH